MKKFLSMFLAITMMASIAVIGATSVSAKTEGYYTYSVNHNGEAVITDVEPYISGDVTIPSTLGGYPVTRIAQKAFSCCTRLTSITIPDSVTYIGYEAFNSCVGLKNITLGSSVESIGEQAFFFCARLENLYINSSFVSGSLKQYEYGLQNPAIYINTSITDISEYILNKPCKSFGIEYEGTTYNRYSLHEYDNTCDTVCNVCGDVRTEVIHSYENKWGSDKDGHWRVCDICDYTNGTKFPHVYGNDSNATCKRCGYVREVETAPSTTTPPPVTTPHGSDNNILIIIIILLLIIFLLLGIIIGIIVSKKKKK